MRHRQKQALAHPVPFTTTPARPHKSRVERVGDRVTILTVGEVMMSSWVWQASVSIPPTLVARWSAVQTQKAFALLLGLLDGVGEQVVFAAGPSLADLNLEGLQQWTGTVSQFGPLSASVHASLPVAMSDLLPDLANLTAMHVWKTLTPAELDVIPTPTEH